MAVAKLERPRGRTIPDIVTDVFTDLMSLVRTEGELARAELSDNIGRAAAGLGLIVGGAVLLTPALVILMQAAVAALTEQGELPSWAAALIVGGAALVIGLILLLIGRSRLKLETLMPNRTIGQLKQDASAAQDQVTTSPTTASRMTASRTTSSRTRASDEQNRAA
jgi:putative superfamily III holin-X